MLDDVWDSKVVSAFQFPGVLGKLLVTSRNKKLGATSAKVVEIGPSDYKNFSEPLLARLALRDTCTTPGLPSEFQVRLQRGVG